VKQRLSEAGYLTDDAIATTVFLADRLGKPLLIEGPAGVGKTELAKSVATAVGAELIRLQCYEGLDEARALYEWDYRKQLLRLQAAQGPASDAADQWGRLHDDLFGESFLLSRPLLEAIRAQDPVVLLIDEVDRLDVETEALLLEVLSDYQVSIPELGTVTASSIPRVFLTSNSSRELSEALKRRCLYLHLGYPVPEREREIVLARVPGISEHLAGQIAQVVATLRGLELRKRPSVSESLDWARTLLVLGAGDVEAGLLADTMNVLLKDVNDITTAIKELAVPE
jgi:MoxR-like ATPase